jgi:hypothetical protein
MKPTRPSSSPFCREHTAHMPYPSSCQWPSMPAMPRQALSDAIGPPAPMCRMTSASALIAA